MAEDTEGLSNSARFLVAFNRIERRLADISGVEDYRSFAEKLRGASRREPAVGHIEAELRELAELRNALVHSDRAAPLAEPHDEVVAEIERYLALLTDPPLVGSRFTKRVATIREDDPVRLAVRLMRDRGYSQLPVRDRHGRCIALITGATIARWLGSLGGPRSGSRAAADVVDLDGTTIGRMLELAECDENYVFLRPEATLFDALWEYESHQLDGRRLDAILISRDAQPDQSLIGIITPRDLPRIMMELEYTEEGRGRGD